MVMPVTHHHVETNRRSYVPLWTNTIHELLQMSFASKFSTGALYMVEYRWAQRTSSSPQHHDRGCLPSIYKHALPLSDEMPLVRVFRQTSTYSSLSRTVALPTFRARTLHHCSSGVHQGIVAWYVGCTASPHTTAQSAAI